MPVRLRLEGRRVPQRAVPDHHRDERDPMTAAHTASAAPPSQGSAGKIVIDFLFLDLNTCTRCIGTDKYLSAALQETRNVLEAAGRPVEVHKHLVRTEQDARRHRRADRNLVWRRGLRRRVRRTRRLPGVDTSG